MPLGEPPIGLVLVELALQKMSFLRPWPSPTMDEDAPAQSETNPIVVSRELGSSVRGPAMPRPLTPSERRTLRPCSSVQPSSFRCGGWPPRARKAARRVAEPLNEELDLRLATVAVGRCRAAAARGPLCPSGRSRSHRTIPASSGDETAHFAPRTEKDTPRHAPVKADPSWSCLAEASARGYPRSRQVTKNARTLTITQSVASESVLLRFVPRRRPCASAFPCRSSASTATKRR